MGKCLRVLYVKPSNKEIYYSTTKTFCIELVKYTKFLGLYIDDEVTWKYDLDHVATKYKK